MSEHKVREENERVAKESRREKLLAEFDKDANAVLLRSEIIFGAVSGGDGRYGIQCGEYPTGMVKMVSYDLFFRSMMMFQGMELAAAMKAQSEKKIITPN
jgi:hypothetical protein